MAVLQCCLQAALLVLEAQLCLLLVTMHSQHPYIITFCKTI
jgi:hypothetical protein